MIDDEQILSFLRTTGPTLPSKVAKNIGTEILFASAHMSFLVSQGKLKISSLKIGGSPLYYLSGQEAQLYPFAAGNVNPKELQVLDKLKEKSVMREGNLDLLSKVALRSLKDFAVPLHVTVNNNRELFWKWYLLSPDETKKVIGDILKESEPSEPEPAPKETVKEEAELQVTTSPVAEPEAKPIPKPVKVVKEELIVSRPSAFQEEQKKLTDNKSSIKADNSNPSKGQDKKSKAIKNIVAPTSPFLTSVQDYLKKLKIEIKDIEVVRKSSEFNLKVEIPSVVGKTTYLCKAKKKYRVDEKEVSVAYMEAQILKLPLLFLYTNQITKKAEEMLKADAFYNIITRKIE